MLAPLAQKAEPAIATETEAAAVLIEIGDLMGQLRGAVEEETALVRAGCLVAAASVAHRKAALSGAFMAAAARIRQNAHILSRAAPQLLDGLRRQQDEVRSSLKANLTVLATARAVAESIVRNASSELARHASPRIYGASGRHHTPSARVAAPIALCRNL